MAQCEVVYPIPHPLPHSFRVPRFTVRCSDALPPNYFGGRQAFAFFESGGPDQQIGGLINIGSNCYINSVLQCLAYTPGFGDFCRSLPNALYERNSQGAFFLDSFGHVYTQMIEKKATCPDWFLHDSHILSNRFRLPFQEDAHEFLIKLLSRFDDECRNAIHSPESVQTFISRYFRWTVTSESTCEHCQHTSTVTSEFLDRTVPIRGIPNLLDAIGDLGPGGGLRLSSQCESCGMVDCVIKRTTAEKYPLILIVTLMRFDNNLTKIDDFIEFPNILAVGKEELLYQLYALIVHEGKVINHGHFTAFVRDQNDIWYKADDMCVFKANAATVMSSRPYLLFYKRVI
jgi:ubiquitin C-terminal hydrolase